MWDDLGSPFLQGTGPGVTVLDPDGTPNNIVDVALGGSLKVDWTFTGTFIAMLPGIQFTVTVYADPVGPGAANMVLGTNPVPPPPPTAPSPSTLAYTTSIPIPAGAPLTAGAYRLTTIITAVAIAGGGSVPIAGFVDGPLIQVRPGP